MEPQESSQARFIFPPSEFAPDQTPGYTSDNMTPAASETKLSDVLQTTAISDAATIPQSIGNAISTSEEDRLIPRFNRLLDQSKALVNTQGPYTSYAGTTVFARAPIARKTSEEASTKDFAISLAAAQDCAQSAQTDGPAKGDLLVFERLANTTIEVLETILSSGDLDYESLGWGVYGLSAGYQASPWRREASPILSYKKRLHDALRNMPSMESTVRKDLDSIACCGGKIEVLAKANREIHICANLLLQHFRREEWRCIRWYHAVAVAQRWIGHLGLERAN